MSDNVFESYYREIFSDLTVSREESEEVREKFQQANPPPDKIRWLRSSAFRIGCEFLTEDDNDSNVSLLRSINALVHALEYTCMRPKVNEEQEEEFDDENLEAMYRKLMSDLTVDREENQELFNFFNESKPPKSKLIWLRSSAFRIGSEFLTDSKEDNVSLLRTINAIVQAVEMTCMTPVPYVLKMEPPESISIDAVGTEASISQAAQYLWDLDVNRLTPDADYQINVQGGKKPYWQDDAAADPLFTFVDTKIFHHRPTYKTFVNLLDNYSAETGVAERVTHVEKREQKDFLRAIMQSAPMQFCHKYCVANGKGVPSDAGGFINLLEKIWFDLYFRERGGGRDSSGFEHVFVGEIKNEKVSGFHNWIYYYLEEKKGNVDYRGYIKPRSYSAAETNSDDHVLTLQFTWNGVEKSVGTSFIGVSPEFEMALYTMCFLVGEEQNTIDLNTGTDEFKLNCKVYKMARDKVGTCYVEALEHYD